MEHSIFITRAGTNYGPYSEEEIHGLIEAGNVSPDDLSWKDGMSDWRPLREVMEGVCHPTLPPQPPPASVARKGMGAMVWAAVIISAAIFLGMIVSAVKSSNDPAVAGPEEHYLAAVATVRNNLKAPSTAKFSSFSDQASGCSNVSGNVWEATGLVDSQNGFGAMLRSPWRLVWNVSTRQILFFRLDRKDRIGNYQEAIAAAKQTNP